MALRGRFLVGSHPVGGDFARRFVASAAESGIDVFRLHDPLNDVENLREAGEAITAADREFDAGLVYSPGRGGRDEADRSSRPGSCPTSAPRASCSTTRPGRWSRSAAHELVAALAEESGLPVGIYCQGAAGSGLAAALEAARAGADRIACAVYPIALTLHRVSGEGARQRAQGARASTAASTSTPSGRRPRLVDEFIGDDPVTPLAPRIAVRAAQHELPAGLVAAIDTRLRAHGASDRLDDVLDELAVIRKRGRLAAGGGPDRPDPGLAGDRPRALRRALPDGRRRAARPPRRRASARRRARSTRRCSGPSRSFPRTSRRRSRRADLDEIRDDAEGLAASEEELLLLALFGEEAEPLLRGDPGPRRRGEDALLGGGVDQTRAERIREIVRIVQETGVAEISDRGGRNARLGPAHRRAGPGPGGRADAAARRRRLGRARCRWPPPIDGAHPNRGADGRHVLSRARSPARRRSSRKATPWRPARRSASSRR